MIETEYNIVHDASPKMIIGIVERSFYFIKKNFGAEALLWNRHKEPMIRIEIGPRL
jgi:hypothetical protein